MLERLSTDRSIAPLVAQFVPLKIATDGPDWGKWASRYRPEGNAIPMLFVVKADGTMMYGKSGSKQGDELPRFLAEHLITAGTIFSDGQLGTIKAAVDESNKALSEGDAFTAARRISGLKGLGQPGKLGSYASVALEADALYAKLLEQGQAALKTAQEQLASEDKFSGVLGIVSANRIYGSLIELRKDLVSAERDLGKDASLKESLKQAQALDRALAMLSQKGGKKQAVPVLETVVTRFPNTPAAEAAKAKLTELGATVAAEAAVVPPAAAIPAASSAMRTWSDVTGKFRIEAELVSNADGKVQLKRKDGQVVTVPLEKLSKADQDFLSKQ